VLLPRFPPLQSGAAFSSPAFSTPAFSVAPFKTWCLAIRPGAFLHTVAWRPWASTCSPHGQLCGTHRLRPRRIPTATRTASSSSRRPHKNLAFCDGSTKEFSVSARSAWSPGLSQKDCSSSLLPDKTDQRYYHRPRRHERQLVDKHNKLFSNNVMIRMLYTNYY